MKVEVRLFATFRDGREKKQIMELEENSTILDVLNIVNIEEDEVAVMLLNGIDGPGDRTLKENDVVSLFPPVGGGWFYYGGKKIYKKCNYVNWRRK